MCLHRPSWFLCPAQLSSSVQQRVHCLVQECSPDAPLRKENKQQARRRPAALGQVPPWQSPQTLIWSPSYRAHLSCGAHRQKNLVKGALPVNARASVAARTQLQSTASATSAQWDLVLRSETNRCWRSSCPRRNTSLPEGDGAILL